MWISLKNSECFLHEDNLNTTHFILTCYILKEYLKIIRPLVLRIGRKQNWGNRSEAISRVYTRKWKYVSSENHFSNFQFSSRKDQIAKRWLNWANYIFFAKLNHIAKFSYCAYTNVLYLSHKVLHHMIQPNTNMSI